MVTKRRKTARTARTKDMTGEVHKLIAGLEYIPESRRTEFVEALPKRKMTAADLATVEAITGNPDRREAQAAQLRAAFAPAPRALGATATRRMK